MSWQDVGIIITFITAVSGLFVSFSTRKKLDAEATDVLTKTAMQLVTPLKEELSTERNRRIELETTVDGIKKELADVRWENSLLWAGITRLIHQLLSLGHVPVFNPEVELAKKQPPTND